MAKQSTQMSQGDEFRLYDAVRTARSTTASREQIKAAAQVQKELKAKYPDIYGAVRGRIFNEIKAEEGYSKGGSATKKVPVISIGVGMAEMKKGKKPEMRYGGSVKGKKHNYAAGGSVTDNAGLRALKKASPKAYNKITGN